MYKWVVYATINNSFIYYNITITIGSIYFIDTELLTVSSSVQNVSSECFSALISFQFFKMGTEIMLLVDALVIPMGELDSLVGRNNEDDSSSFFTSLHFFCLLYSLASFLSWSFYCRSPSPTCSILLTSVCDGSFPHPPGLCRLTPDLWVYGNNLPDLGGQSLH